MHQRVLVDTSAWIEALRQDGDERIRGAVRELTQGGAAVLCDIVLLELWNGASGAEETRMLRDLERELECVATTEEVWRSATAMARACRGKGVTVPATDLLIAACAERHDLGLLHHDADFERITAVTGRGSR